MTETKFIRLSKPYPMAYYEQIPGPKLTKNFNYLAVKRYIDGNMGLLLTVDDNPDLEEYEVLSVNTYDLDMYDDDEFALDVNNLDRELIDFLIHDAKAIDPHTYGYAHSGFCTYPVMKLAKND